MKRNDLVVTKPAPARHHHLCSEINLAGMNPNEFEQGFLGSDGQFYTRFQARQRAFWASQITHSQHSRELFSEDLW